MSESVTIAPGNEEAQFAQSPRVRPLSIGFELTNLCNLHCTHCIRGSWQKEIDHLDLPFIRGVLDQAAKLFDPLSVTFTGGEPLASELFPAAVRELSTRGLPYGFVTNGWLLPRHLPTLLNNRPRFVRLSLSGGTERTHDLSRGAGSFRRVLVGAAALMSRAIRVELSMVITRDSRQEMETAVALANALGVAEFHLLFPQPTPETAAGGNDLSPNEWREAGFEITSFQSRSAVPVILDYGAYLPLPRFLCNTLAFRQLYVDAKGCVPFCCQLSRYGTGQDPILGDLRRESLAAIVERAEAVYADFTAETTNLHQIGRRDALDDYPCLSCARRHGKTGFLRDFPEHPWSALARPA